MPAIRQPVLLTSSTPDHDAIESGRCTSFERPEITAILTSADKCVTGSVGDATFQAARSVLGDRGLVTTIVLVGHYRPWRASPAY